ncbi:histidine phosphatase family protein [Ideonella sp. DXS29W]|uniref:Histidine phosphatase family protein n=1 Tax=Ideonella lacteola TaxID=2984193 RepID=A0ABU9BXM3_9BURK
MRNSCATAHWIGQAGAFLLALASALPVEAADRTAGVQREQALFLGVRAPVAGLDPGAELGVVAEALEALGRGGYVVVFRHGASMSDEKDEIPLVLSDCSKQRNLSDWGRDTMQGLGGFLAERNVRFSVAYSSAMCRAVDTARRLTSAGVVPVMGITMAGGMAGGMSGDTQADAEGAQTLRSLVSTVPAKGTNTLVVTHAPNLVAAFGADLSGVPEGGAVVFEPHPSGDSTYSVRWRLPLWAVANYARHLRGMTAP